MLKITEDGQAVDFEDEDAEDQEEEFSNEE